MAASYVTVMEFTSSTVTRVTRQTAWFTFYGDPAHFTYDTKQFLKFNYPNPLTGRKGSVLWPM